MQIPGPYADILKGGFFFPPFGPFLPLPFPSSPLPSSPLEVGPLNPARGVWRSAMSSPSGVWSGAPAEIEFGAF